MKRYLLSFTLIIVAASLASAQADLAPDQNPDYAISRAKYMEMADSLNEWHSTTIQDTYRAIDWMADRAEYRAERRAFRRQLRLERAKWYGYNYYSPSYYPSYNYRYYRNYGRRYRHHNARWGFTFWWP